MASASVEGLGSVCVHEVKRLGSVAHGTSVPSFGLDSLGCGASVGHR